MTDPPEDSTWVFVAKMIVGIGGAWVLVQIIQGCFGR